MSCKFCEDYEFVKGYAKRKSLFDGCNQYIKVRMHEYYVRNKKTVSTFDYKPRELNFCPECGRKLKTSRAKIVDGRSEHKKLDLPPPHIFM